MISILDTTLRDGEQREGLTVTVEDKLRIARRLDQLGVTYVEGGFAGSNPTDDEFFARVGELGLQTSRIVAFGTTCRKSEKAEGSKALADLLACNTPVVSVVGKSWDKQVEQVLETSLDENLRMIRDSVAYLVAQGRELLFAAEHFFDGFKANEDYALAAVCEAARAGAGTIVLCDTNGGTLPFEVYQTVQRVVAAVGEAAPGTDVGIHAHDDCGCAVANTLEAVFGGATHVQGTVNGYGERVGNANLITIIANLELKMGRQTVGRERLQQLTSVSQYVAETCNITPDVHQPFVGSSAFAHKGGLHVSAIQRMPAAYEHVQPSAVGNLTRIVVSELAGRAALVSKAAELGVDLHDDDALVMETLTEIKAREAGGYSFEVADASLALFLREKKGLAVRHFVLESFRVIADKREDGRVMTEATIKIHVGDRRFIATGEGNGPVNALDNALRVAITEFYPQIEAIELTDYKVRVLDESCGTDAITRVLIESSDGQESWGTVGVSENIIEASWDALVDAIEYGLLKVAAL